MTAPGPAFRRTGRISQLLFHWSSARRDVNAISGHVASLIRAATASPVDLNGTTYTAEWSQPAWQANDLDADGVRETSGLLLGATDFFDFPYFDRPRLQTIYVKFVEDSSAVSGKGIMALGIAAGSSPYLRLEAFGGKYRASHHNGIGPAVTSAAAAAPSSTDLVELRGVLRADGSVLLGQAINSGAEAVAAASSALTLPGAWSSTRLLVNRVDPSTVGTMTLLQIKIAAGELALADIRTRF